ncbi:hypothetical protein BOX15_Mlig003558g2 [Macrostomum lignano]|uniref:Protein quiver n=1 Tax=Macrostomum lignano TaxID=282301 RepID=A0A267G652_9PLAT|nr:hypothetical protein BOX15_Mlig003558g1 [Macrostomum lignano]PAA80864.1 hypothetical protein BOX15_Mlig003558g2 [Macrostomum lignano]
MKNLNAANLLLACCTGALLIALQFAPAQARRPPSSNDRGGNFSCYECNVFRGETGARVQCQEYTEDPETKTRNWIIVPINRLPITKKMCKACGTYVTWSENHHRKPRGGDESQVTLVISRFCMEEEVDSRFHNGRCVENLGSHSIMQRCFCFSDNCNNYESWSMTKFGP